MGFLLDKYKGQQITPPVFGSITPKKTESVFDIQKIKTSKDIEKNILKIPSTKDKKTLVGGVQNAAEDILDISKGILSLGYNAITHPLKTIETAAKVTQFVTGETLKHLPKSLGEIADTVLHPIERGSKLVSGVRQLHQISLEEQNKLFDSWRQSFENLPDDEKIVASLGSGLIQDFVGEVSHPAEFAYEHPVLFSLDVMGVGEVTGGAKLFGKGAKAGLSFAERSEKIRVAKDYVGKQLSRVFVPQGKLRFDLKSQGFNSEFADDLAELQGEIAWSRYKTMEDTLQKFNPKTFKDKALEKVTGKKKDSFELTRKEQTEFFNTIDKLRRSTDVPTSINPKIQSAISWWLTEAKVLAKEAGVKEGSVIQNYLHHVFPEKLRPRGDILRPIQKSNRGYLKQSKDITGFSTDPIASIATIKSRVKADNLMDAFIAKQTGKYGKTLDQLRSELGVAKEVGDTSVLKQAGFDEYKPKGNLRFFPIETVLGGKAIGVTKKVQTVYLPKAMADELNSFGKQSGRWDFMLEPIDLFHREWKPLATAFRLRYHTRNIVGNVWNASFIGGAKPTSYVKALKAQFDNFFGKDTKEAKLYQEGVSNRVVGRGFFGADLTDMYRLSDVIDKVRSVDQLRLNRSLLGRLPVVKQYMSAMWAFGEFVENNARLALYRHAREVKKMDLVASRNYVNKHLFDYLTGLGEGDKLIKRFIPFWSWQRFNIPLQANFVMTQRIKNLILAKAGITKATEDQRNDPLFDALPEYRKERGATRVTIDEKTGEIGYIHTKAVLPYSDLAGFFQALTSADESDIASFSPIFTVPAGLMKNIDEFRDRPIERFKGEKTRFLGQVVTQKTSFTLQAIPFLSEINKVIGGSYLAKEKPELARRLSQSVNPFAMAYLDPIATVSFAEFRKEMEKADALGGAFDSGILRDVAREYFRSPEDPVRQQNFHIYLSSLIDKYPPEDIVSAITSGERSAIKSAIRKDVQRQLGEGVAFPSVDSKLKNRLEDTYDRKSARSSTRNAIKEILTKERESFKKLK